MRPCWQAYDRRPAMLSGRRATMLSDALGGRRRVRGSAGLPAMGARGLLLSPGGRGFPEEWENTDGGATARDIVDASMN